MGHGAPTVWVPKPATGSNTDATLPEVTEVTTKAAAVSGGPAGGEAQGSVAVGMVGTYLTYHSRI